MAGEIEQVMKSINALNDSQLKPRPKPPEDVKFEKFDERDKKDDEIEKELKKE